MARKRSRSAVSARSGSRKCTRGAAGGRVAAGGRGAANNRGTRTRGQDCSTTALPKLKTNISRGAVSRLRYSGLRGRGVRATGLQSGNQVRSVSPCSSGTSINDSINSSSDSEDSGPMSLDLAPSDSETKLSSDLTIVNKPDKWEDEKLVPEDGLTVTDKLMNVVTGALPALGGELAAHARGVLRSRRAHPLAAMLRTLARFTTNIMPTRKRANCETRAEGTTMEYDTKRETSVNMADNNTSPVVSCLWKQPSDERMFSLSDDTLVSSILNFEEAGTTKCHQMTLADSEHKYDGKTSPVENHGAERNRDPTQDMWEPTSHMSRDPRLQKRHDPQTHTNEDLAHKINGNLTPEINEDPKSQKDWDSTLMSRDPRLRKSQDTPTFCDETSQTDKDSHHNNNEPKIDLDTTQTDYVQETNGEHKTTQRNFDVKHVSPEPSIPKNQDLPSYGNNDLILEPINRGPTLSGDNKQQFNLDPTIDHGPSVNGDPTEHINEDPMLQTSGDFKPNINGDPTPQTSYASDLTPHVNDDLPQMEWDLTLDDDDDDDIDTMLRKIDCKTSAMELTLLSDEENLDNLFPEVTISHKLGTCPKSPQTTPRVKPPRGASVWGRGARGRGARGRRGPRERPDSPEEVLAALQDAMLQANDILSVAQRPYRSGAIFQDKEEDAEDETEMGVAETYAEYTPAKLDFGCGHPDPVVETASLSSVESADVTYKLSLPDSTTHGGLLSALQLEAVVYASQAHEQMLPDGTRAGFLIGDGAGVGKGRTIAGIIFENYRKGRKRAIWVSVSNDLKVDAERDLQDIGAGEIEVHPLNKMNYNSITSLSNEPVTEGVVFSTYSALIGFTTSVGVKYNTRLKQLLAWCGTDFDGCIVFDECHRAKNLCPVTATKPSKTGLAVLNIQRTLPKARLVYASATGASEPKNMAYMVRLGIWGEGTPFTTFKDFLVAVERRGVGAMEIVAMDMKLRGMYIARQLSFHGVTFKIEEVPLSLAFRETYDKAVALWVKAMQSFKEGVELVNPSHKWRKVMWAQFWGAHQRFFKYLCIAAKVLRTVKHTREAVSNGKCVVIGLQSTGEARTLDQLERDDGKLSEFICTAKGVFQSLVQKQFPDPDNIKDEDRPTPSPEVRQQTKEMKRNLLKYIAQLGKCLPPNTLDQLVDELGGAKKVAEMTGRKGRVVQMGNGQIQYESRSEADVPLETLNLTEKQRFMDGEKDVAIISEAASSGISLQSDRRVKNQRRRVHITLELPWSADRAIQQFGRTHRSNQMNAPEYIFLISDLAGERRFASTVAKRLESLGALTHGDRRATETRDLSQFNIENKFGRAALRRMQHAVSGAQTPLVEPPRDYAGDFLRDAAAALAAVGYDLHNDQESVDIQRFLNRLLGVPVLLQNALFQYFNDTFVAIVQEAKRSGRFDLGILDLGSAGECVRRVRCVRFLRRHATGRAPVELHTVLSERGLEWEKAERKSRELTKPGEGFYLSRARWNNNYNAILCVAAGHRMYNIYRPNLGLQLRQTTLAEIEKKYVKASRLAAMAPWHSQYEHSLSECTHTYWHGACSKFGCEVGLRVRTYHVLSGSVLAVWARLDAVMKQLNLSNRLQVVRVKTDQGLKIVGTLLPKRCIELLTEELKNDAISFTDQTF